MEVFMKLYAIRNKEGKYFKSRGINSIDSRWVDDISKAKIYNKIGTARTIITFYSREFPEYGTPDLIELQVNTLSVIDEEERAKKAIIKIKENRVKDLIKAQECWRNKNYYQQDIEKLQDEIEHLKNGE